MPIILARIDDRFIHGQVTVGWSQKLRPTRIVLSNDEIAADDWQSRVYASSVPPRIAVSVLSGADTVAALAPVEEPPARDRTILIAGSPGDMHYLCTHGLSLAEINVGGMHFLKGKAEMLPFVYVDRTDLDVFRSLLAKGVRLSARQVPGAREVAIDLAMIAAAEECL